MIELTDEMILQLTECNGAHIHTMLAEHGADALAAAIRAIARITLQARWEARLAEVPDVG